MYACLMGVQAYPGGTLVNSVQWVSNMFLIQSVPWHLLLIKKRLGS